MTSEALDALLAPCGLAVRGIVPTQGEDVLPDGTRCVVLLGPDEPRFWAVFRAAPESSDGLPNPLDRWSKRVIGAVAEELGAAALFPSDGPPYAPFLSWATASGRCWVAPVGLLVHDHAGLMISFRGALAVQDALPADDPPAERPCDACAAPCATACPVGAMAPGQPYDVPACQAHVASAAGRECRTQGCLVRRACPVSQAFGRHPAQSAFHMAAFMQNYRA